MTKEKIIDKIRKLKALAGSSNEHEASNVMQKMQAIMARHNLKDCDVRIDEFGKDFFVSYNGQWAKEISMSVSELYFCSVLFGKLTSSKTKYYVVGKKENIQPSIEIIESILNSVNSASRYSSCKKSFLIGSAVTINRRCQKLIQEANDGNLVDETGTALVLGDLYLSSRLGRDNYIRDNMSVKILKPKAVCVENFAAYKHGLEFGDKISLNKELQ